VELQDEKSKGIKFLVTNPQPPFLVLRYDESNNVSGKYVCRAICIRRIYFFRPLLCQLIYSAR